MHFLGGQAVLPFSNPAALPCTFNNCQTLEHAEFCLLTGAPEGAMNMTKGGDFSKGLSPTTR